MKQRTNNQLPVNLPQLQNLIKRDPESYNEEFKTQYNHFSSLVDLLRLQPQEYNEDFDNLVMFLAQVSSCYPKEPKSFPHELISILRQYSTILDPNTRMTLCRAIVLMRNKGLLEPADFLSLFFELLHCKDKALRKFLQVQIITDIKNTNAKHKNVRLNTDLQNFMYNMLKDSHEIAAKMSLDVMVELYRKQVWRDAKTVNVIATGCFSKFNKVVVAALSFFLGSDPDNEKKDSDESESEEEKVSLRDVMSAMKVNKKTRHRKKMLKRTKQVIKKTKRKPSVFDFSALHFIHDPHELAEKLLKKLESLKERFEMKILMMNFISRLIGAHNLMILNYYPLLQRFLQPHQRDVTRILMFAAQAAHELVPPDVIEPVIREIANNFITERNSTEVMTVGLNSIREICMRCPFAMDSALLEDLVEYRTYKNKNVSMAAKSIIQLFRKINPQLLAKSRRGKPTEAIQELKPLSFGEIDAKSYVPGTEVLSEEVIEEPSENRDSDNDDSDGWVDIDHPSDIEDNDESAALANEEEEEDDDDDDEEENSEEDNNKEHKEEVEKRDTEMDGKSDTRKEGGSGMEDLEKNPNKEDSAGTESMQPDAKTNKMRKNAETKKINKKSVSQVVVEKQQKATNVSVGRILSQEEFKKVKVAQLVKQLKGAKKRKKDEEECERKEVVSLRDIEKLHKKPKHDKDSRLATVREGREGREKYGRKPETRNTHKVKKRNKAFAMVKHKFKAKAKRSFKEKQVSLRNALLKQRKMKTKF